ncbi:Uncharacterised protein [Legionella pneumophila]|nr:Uncharacterised protein [Legionella pneumophila]
MHMIKKLFMQAMYDELAHAFVKTFKKIRYTGNKCFETEADSFRQVKMSFADLA